MRACLYVLFLFSLAHPTLADVWVKGYHNSNGDYVKGHWRSSPNDTKADNWTTRGNINPHTGKLGTRSYDDYNNGHRGPITSPRQNSYIAGDDLPGHYRENGDFYHDDGNIYNPYIAMEENDSEWVGRWRTETSSKFVNQNNAATGSKSHSSLESVGGIILLAVIFTLGPWVLIARGIGRLQYLLFSEKTVEKAEHYTKFGMTVATIVVGWVLYLIFLT